MRKHPSALGDRLVPNRRRDIAIGELQAVVMFCAIGFLATVNVVVRFPEFGATVAQLAIFP